MWNRADAQWLPQAAARLHRAPAFLPRSLLGLAFAIVMACGRSTTDDQVILRDGTVKRGELSICAVDACTLSGAAIARSSIVLIGLNGARRAPKLQDPLHDEVQLSDESILMETMTGIDAAHVVTDQGSHPRERMAWIYLAPRPSTGAQDTASRPGAGPSYEWSGTIGVQNQYDGSEGHHHWEVMYTAKFLEVEVDSTVSGEAGKTFHVNEFIPVAFGYEMQADETLDKHTYSPGSVTMSGHASGELTAEEAKQKKVLRGEIIRIEGQPSADTPPGTSLASEQEYFQYQANVGHPSKSGWFDLSISFIRFIDHDSYSDIRALYHGIERGGQGSPFFADPDHDLIHWVPAWMPEGTTVIGRLDSADQKEVHGSTSFPRQGPGSAQDREQITLTWQFQRTRQ